jgi:hypothetical protein
MSSQDKFQFYNQNAPLLTAIRQQHPIDIDMINLPKFVTKRDYNGHVIENTNAKKWWPYSNKEMYLNWQLFGDHPREHENTSDITKIDENKHSHQSSHKDSSIDVNHDSKYSSTRSQLPQLVNTKQPTTTSTVVTATQKVEKPTTVAFQSTPTSQFYAPLAPLVPFEKHHGYSQQNYLNNSANISQQKQQTPSLINDQDQFQYNNQYRNHQLQQQRDQELNRKYYGDIGNFKLEQNRQNQFSSKSYYQSQSSLYDQNPYIQQHIDHNGGAYTNYNSHQLGEIVNNHQHLTTQHPEVPFSSQHLPIPGQRNIQDTILYLDDLNIINNPYNRHNVNYVLPPQYCDADIVAPW